MENFSTIDLVNQCLIDKKRTSAFKKAIEKAVKPGDFVLDLGTGSGILALFAAKAGAKKVFGCEIDKYTASVAKNNVKQNNLDKTIKIFSKDVVNSSFKLKIKPDLIISEMLTTGCIEEFQVPAFNVLIKRGGRHFKSTKIIPLKQETYVELVNIDFNAYGFSIPMVRHFWPQFKNNPKFEILSKKYLINSLDFRKINKLNVNKTINFKILKSGIVNGIRFTSKTHLDESIILDDTESLNYPVIVPFKELKVKKGEDKKIKINYQISRGFSQLKTKLLN